MLFNLYLNDLAFKVNALGKGVKIDDTVVSISLYADDVVLFAESEADLQAMVDTIGAWCKNNLILINVAKSNTEHYCNPSVRRSDIVFNVNDDTLAYAAQYKYLGLVLTEQLDYTVTAKIVAQSARRALGLLIAKSKACCGLLHEPFTKLYESVVVPIITYGAAIWATHSYSCINAIQHRAARYFLNVGRYTPNAAVSGDIGLAPMVTINRFFPSGVGVLIWMHQE